MCVFCAQDCFACAPYHIRAQDLCSPSSSCETGRNASIILMTITTCVSICRPQNVKAGHGVAGVRERLREGGSRNRGPRGQSLEICYQHRARPCQHHLAVSYRDTHTHTTAHRLCWNSDWCSYCHTASSGSEQKEQYSVVFTRLGVWKSTSF